MTTNDLSLTAVFLAAQKRERPARMPEFITFTGVDERTDLARLQELSSRYPVEWAALFSVSRQGRDPRYPGPDFIGAFRALAVAKAAHLCGVYADMVVKGRGPRIGLNGFRRVQVNHSAPNADAIWRYAVNANLLAIMQTSSEDFPYTTGGTLCLFDRSGGTGARPNKWPENPGWLVGYAGGIGPDNVLDTIAAINSSGPYWLDMESGVRTDDWLDLDKCEAVLRAVYQ